MANAVQNLAAQTPGKEAIAIEAFAKALRQVSAICSFRANLMIQSIKCVDNIVATSGIY